jgi:hypothetical protein
VRLHATSTSIRIPIKLVPFFFSPFAFKSHPPPHPPPPRGNIRLHISVWLWSGVLLLARYSLLEVTSYSVACCNLFRFFLISEAKTNKFTEFREKPQIVCTLLYVSASRGPLSGRLKQLQGEVQTDTTLHVSTNHLTYSINHSVVCLKDRSVTLSKRVLHRVRSSASSFNFQYILISLTL